MGSKQFDIASSNRVEIPKGFIDILKQIKHKRPQPKICPSCMSSNIFPQKSYGIFPTIYSCRDCDYKGNIVLEIDLGKQE